MVVVVCSGSREVMQCNAMTNMKKLMWDEIEGKF